MKKKCKNIDEKTGKVCGHINQSDAEYCAMCGAKLNSNTKPRIWLIVLITLLFVGVCVTICLDINNKQDSIRVEIRAKSAVDSMGTVLGGGVYVKDTTIILIPLPREGFRFVSWNDGNTDSIRTVVADHDQEFIAFFKEKPQPRSVHRFKITAEPNNPEWGTATGGGSADSLAVVTIKAEAKEDCQFVKWNDGNADSIRTVVADHDQEFIAFFKENPKPCPVPRFEITVKSNNPDKGTVNGGNKTYDSLSIVTIEAIEKDGYQFVKWNDGNKEKSRKVVVVRDQTYRAEFEKVALPPVEEPGKCKIQYSFGRYEGDCKNGIPEGEGTMYYSCRVQIAKHDTDKPVHYAEAGDWFVGSWGNGDIVVGVLYGKDGNTKERINAPKRFNPYDLHRDKCVQ